MNYMTEIQGREPARRTMETRGRKNVYPFRTLPLDGAFIHPKFNTAKTLAWHYHKLLGHRYDIVQIAVGARIRRVA